LIGALPNEKQPGRGFENPHYIKNEVVRFVAVFSLAKIEPPDFFMKLH